MKNIKVSNLTNENGNKVANQFIIKSDNKVIFQSYESIICIVDYDSLKITLGCDWDYSRTTKKHLKNFIYNQLKISIDDKIIREAMENGEISNNYYTYKVTYDENLK